VSHDFLHERLTGIGNSSAAAGSTSGHDSLGRKTRENKRTFCQTVNQVLCEDMGMGSKPLMERGVKTLQELNVDSAG
jgi:hypothetical protein